MMNQCCLWTFFMGICLALYPPFVIAQSGRLRGDEFRLRTRWSHLDEGKFPPPQQDPEEFLRERLNQRRFQEAVEQLRKSGVRPEDLAQLLKQNPNLLDKDLVQSLKNVPREHVPPSLRNFWDQFSVDSESPEWRKQFESIRVLELTKYFEIPGNRTGFAPSTEADLADTRSPQNSSPVSRSPEPTNGRAAASQSRIRSGQTAPLEASAPDSSNPQLPKRMLDLADRLMKAQPSLAHSPALANAIQKWESLAQGQDERWNKLVLGLRKLEDEFVHWNRQLRLDRLAPQRGLHWPRGLTPDSMPTLRWPDFDSRLGGRSTGPRLENPGPSSNLLNILLVPIGALVLGAILWKMRARFGFAESVASADGSCLGPWPVNPAAIATPEELIRGFEYLAVLCLGPAARHCNHRAIAASLIRRIGVDGHQDGATTTGTPSAGDRRQAVEQLAALYERARYAPAGDALPMAAMIAAQQDLSLLAGAASL